MMQTINISLPKALFEQINRQVKTGSYASISEFIRESTRHLLRLISYDFSPEAEKEILKISKSSLKDDLVFDSNKTSVKAMFGNIKKAKV